MNTEPMAAELTTCTTRMVTSAISLFPEAPTLTSSPILASIPNTDLDLDLSKSFIDNGIEMVKI